MDTRADRGADDAGDGRWMTYAELGQARGISKESALKLALRRKWRKQDDNRGQVRVYVPIEWTLIRDKRAALGADERADMSRAISVLDAAVATLKQELAHGNARFEAERTARMTAEAEATALRVQIDHARAEAGEAARAVAALRQADDARKAIGRLARLKQAWRGE
jgi:hypothetical protein